MGKKSTTLYMDPEDLVSYIRPGDRVTILRPAGKRRSLPHEDGHPCYIQEWSEATGTASIKSIGHCALNMGGAHGTPGVADAHNIVSVKRAGEKIIRNIKR